VCVCVCVCLGVCVCVVGRLAVYIAALTLCSSVPVCPDRRQRQCSLVCKQHSQLDVPSDLQSGLLSDGQPSLLGGLVDGLGCMPRYVSE
jgi:hypothetical protein